jgi:hypothetical protein
MYRVLILLLLSALAFSQTTTPAPKPATPSAAKPKAPAPPAVKSEAPAKPAAKAEVPPNAAVITIEGVCNGKVPATPSPECKTVISRAEFENLADALDPAMPPARRQQLADAYSRLLVMSDAANQMGIGSTPQAQQVINFYRMQTLMQLLARELQKQASNVPPAETEKYYNEHGQQFEQATLQRLFIPKTPPGGEKPADEKTLQAEAEKLHAAAAAGGDFEKLQKQAYDDLGIKTPPPTTNAGTQRRATLAPGQAKVFDLQPGQISEILNEPAGVYIFKLEAKKKLTLPEVTPEINRTLESERMKEAVDKITKNVKPVLNQQYFGESAPTAPGGMPPGRPPAPPRVGQPPAGAPPTAPPPKPPAQ